MATLRMSVKERRRLELFGKVKRKEMKLRKAAELLGLGYRQAKRSYARYLESGDGGLVHRLRGRPSNRRGDERRRDAILARYRERYVDFGPTLAAEYLAKDGLEVSVATLRRWLVTEKLWQPGRRGSAHRSWRPRRSMFGELVQMDGSHHDWFEGRRAWAVLMVMIDDATNRIERAVLRPESTESAMTVVRHYVNKRGLLRALYVDRDSIFRVNRAANREESLAGTPAAVAIRSCDAGPGRGADLRVSAASEGPCGAMSRDASGLAGEGVAAAGDRDARAGEPLFGEWSSCRSTTPVSRSVLRSVETHIVDLRGRGRWSGRCRSRKSRVVGNDWDGPVAESLV